MSTYESIPIPPKNRRRLGDAGLDWDEDLEKALLDTRNTGKAIKVELWHFHSSPAKGRLWAKHYKVRHRRLDNYSVAAWVEKDEPNDSASTPAVSPDVPRSDSVRN